MSRKTIYGNSYTVNPDDPKLAEKKEILVALESQKVATNRVKQLGRLLKEEKARSQTLQSRINRLDEENRRLRDSLARRSN